MKGTTWTFDLSLNNLDLFEVLVTEALQRVDEVLFDIDIEGVFDLRQSLHGLPNVHQRSACSDTLALAAGGLVYTFKGVDPERLTKVGLLSQLPAIFGHALPQQPLGLWVARILHLPSDLGHGVQHGQLGSGRCGGKLQSTERREMAFTLWWLLLFSPGFG